MDTTTTPIIIPPVALLEQRLRDCHAEQRELKKLLRMARAAEAADAARRRRAVAEGEVARAS